MERGPKGFTLIELLIVIAIIGILSATVLVSLNSARGKARDALRQSDIKQVRTALEVYYFDNGSYPVDGSATKLGEIESALVPKYIPKIPIDPVHGDTSTGYRYRSDNGEKGYRILVNLENDDVSWCQYDGGEPPASWSTVVRCGS